MNVSYISNKKKSHNWGAWIKRAKDDFDVKKVQENKKHTNSKEEEGEEQAGHPPLLHDGVDGGEEEA